MNKEIEIIGYNRITIKKRYENGDCLCDVQLVETDKDGNETTIKSDTDIIFTSEELMLTEEEINILNPKNENIDIIKN